MKYYKTALASLAFATAPVYAIDFDYGGYLSIIAGQTLSGEESGTYLGDVLGYDCPCFIADYANAGVYEDNKISFKPDSGYGLKGSVQFNDIFSLTAQVEGKGGNDFQPQLSWLFMRFDVSSNFSVDIGRKALPLYYYSDFVNVGYAYPTIRASGDIYGWPLTSYNGISGSYSNDLGDGSYTVSAWYGNEKDSDNDSYRELYWGSEEYFIEWSDIVGASVEYNLDWLTLRAVVMQNKADEKADWGTDEDGVADIEIVSEDVGQTFYGLAAIIDLESFIVQAEYNQFDADDFDSKGYLLGLGYRYETLTPMISLSRYSDQDPDFGNQINTTVSYSLRWDFMKSTAFTIQLDVLDDKTKWYEEDEDSGIEEQYTFTGDSKVLAMGIDYVF